MEIHDTNYREKIKYAEIVLRIGIAFAFIYPAIAGFISPENWIGYFPDFVKGYVSDTLLLSLFGASEIIIAFWILLGKKIFIPSVLASFMLLGIIVFNFSQMDVIFRDVTILLATVSLAIFSYKK